MTSIDNCSAELRSCWHPVALEAELADGPTRVEVGGEGFVVVRHAGGEVKAFADRCPHRLGRLSDGHLDGDRLVCPYHGWQYGPDGDCALIPALGPSAPIPGRACLDRVEVAKRYGLVWLAPAKPAFDLPEVTEWDDPALRKVWLPVIDIGAGAAQFVDNFLDFAHFPFVHAGTFGDSESPLIDDYSVTKRPGGLIVDYEHTIVNNEDPLVRTGEHPLVQPRRMRYTYTVPFTAVLRLELPVTGVVNAIASFCQPVDVETTRLYTVMLRNDCADDAAAADAIAYEMAVLAEDLRVIERLPDTSLAVDPAAQLHTRADRLTVEFRRLLRDLITSHFGQAG